MVFAICCTWARTKRVISADDWFYGMSLAAFELVFEIGAALVAVL